MCKLLTFLLAVLFIFPYSNKTVYADSNEYLRIINDTTPFFSDNLGNNLLFYLPFTYYVKIIGSTNDFYHVEIESNGLVSLDGYVPKSQLFKDNLAVSNPYPVITIKTAKDCTFYKDKQLTLPTRYIFGDRDMKYYGFAGEVQNERVYFVSYNNQLGYVKESDVSPFSIPIHPNEQTFLPPPEEPSTQNPENSDGNTPITNNFSELSNAVIVCLVIAGVLSLFIVFGKRKTTTSSAYYDENDYV